MKKTLLYITAILASAGVFGFAAPGLISSKDTLQVFLGFGLVGITLFLWGWHVAGFVKKHASKFAPVMLLFALAACERVDAGHVGVLVYMLGGEKGVDSKVVEPGRYWLTWNEKIFKFPTFTVTDTWAKNNKDGDQSITFQTVEGLSVNADVGIVFNFEKAKIAQIFQKYRRGVEEISDTFLRNAVRDAFVVASSDKPIEVVYGAGKNALIKEVETLVRNEIGGIGIIIENITVVGNFRLPEAVVTAINAKIAATQQAQQRQNEVAEAKAAADKKIEEARGQAESLTLTSKSQAEANIRVAKSLTPELVQYEAIRRWNGVTPTVTGGATPFINLK